MGRDKAKLRAKGRSLTDLMVGKLRAVGCDDVLVSGQDGIADVFPGKGPLAGIHAAMVAMPDTEQLLAVPVDMPDLSANSLQELAQVEAVAVHFCGKILPLKIDISDENIGKLSAILSADNADLSVQSFVGSLAAKTLPMDSITEAEFINLNTPDEWKKWTAHA